MHVQVDVTVVVIRILDDVGQVVAGKSSFAFFVENYHWRLNL